MTTVRTTHFRFTGEWCMKPDTKKILRGLIYTLCMGVVTLVVVVEGATQLNVAIGVFYILGALLVFGVDIQKIEAGPVKIEFESDEERANRELKEYE